jgi:hypothetical protein
MPEVLRYTRGLRTNHLYASLVEFIKFITALIIEEKNIYVKLLFVIILQIYFRESI